MRKTIALVMVILFVLTGVCTMANADGGSGITFSDVPDNAWYKAPVYDLVGRGIINGYSDGTFQPQNNLKVSECIKLIVSALGYKNLGNGEKYWADNYIAKATELGIVKDGEYTNFLINFYEKPMSRPEIAMMVSRALTVQKEEPAANYKDYSKAITDYSKIDPKYQDDVLKVFSKGIVQGYPDGSFGYNQSLTRAEISTLIIRLIDPSKRVTVQDPSTYTSTKTYEYYNDEPVYVGMEKLYPGHTGRSDDGSVVVYKASEAPSYINRVYSFYFRVSSTKKYYYIGLSDADFTNNDKPAFKDLLKLMLPTSYDTVFMKAMGQLASPKDAQDINGTYDGKDVMIDRMDDGLFMMVQRQ